MREGVVYMVRTPWLLATLLFASLMVLATMGPFEVLVPFVIKDQLGGDAGDHAMVLAAFGIGGAVGSLAHGLDADAASLPDLMNLMFGVGCLPMVADGHRARRSGCSSSASFAARRAVQRADGHLGHAAAAAGPARTCWAGSPRSTSSSR